MINIDKAPTYAAALAELKAEGKCLKDTQHRQVKYLNNIVEAAQSTISPSKWGPLKSDTARSLA